MKFNYNFPYPFLDLNHVYRDLIVSEKTSDHFILKIRDIEIEELRHLDPTSYSLGVEVTCSDTLYRKFFPVRMGGLIKIPLDLLRKKVEYDFIGVAARDIDNFRIARNGTPFYIEEGSCFITFRNNTEVIDFDNTLSGLVKVIRDDNSEYLSYDYNQDFLVINLTTKDFDNYERIMEDSKLIPFLHSTLVKPCLMDACYKMVQNPDNFDALWAVVLKNFAEQESYDEGFPSENDIPAFVEKFLKNCTSTTIEFLTNGIHQEEEEPEFGLS